MRLLSWLSDLCTSVTAIICSAVHLDMSLMRIHTWVHGSLCKQIGNQLLDLSSLIIDTVL